MGISCRARHAWPERRGAREDPEHRRCPTQLHEGRAAHAVVSPPSAPEAGAGAHGAALRPEDEPALLRRTRPAAPGSQPRGRQRHARGPDRPHHDVVRETLPRRAPRLGAGGRRRELDHRLRPGRVEARHPRRTRRGRTALGRPHDARGDQPHPDGRAQRFTLRQRVERPRSPRPRGCGSGEDSLRRQRDDRQPARPSRPRRTVGRPRAPRGREPAVCPADAAPPFKRGPPGDPAGHSRGPAGGRCRHAHSVPRLIRARCSASQSRASPTHSERCAT
jgi:hypothetical protein